jgi:HPt (histidine-containing phosphotransfer) domain-containing protein
MARAAITEQVGGAPEPAIDCAHLARMTFGDRALERELLGLFERQATLLVARMREADAVTVRTLAHTLKGSAVGIGAGEVARAAAAVEQDQSPDRLSVLARCVERARADIAAMLR